MLAVEACARLRRAARSPGPSPQLTTCAHAPRSPLLHSGSAEQPDAAAASDEDEEDEENSDDDYVDDLPISNKYQQKGDKAVRRSSVLAESPVTDMEEIKIVPKSAEDKQGIVEIIEQCMYVHATATGSRSSIACARSHTVPPTHKRCPPLLSQTHTHTQPTSQALQASRAVAAQYPR